MKIVLSDQLLWMKGYFRSVFLVLKYPK